MDGYSLKEVVNELKSDNKVALQTQSKILQTLENIDQHMQKLSLEVSSHNDRISTLESFKTKALVIYSAVVFVVVTFVNKFISNF